MARDIAGEKLENISERSKLTVKAVTDELKVSIHFSAWWRMERAEISFENLRDLRLYGKNLET